MGNKLLADGVPGKGNAMSDEDVLRLEELADTKRKLTALVAELEESLSAADAKGANAEKQKSRLKEELDDMSLSLEKAQASASASEKKAKKVDAVVAEFKAKVEELQGSV